MNTHATTPVVFSLIKKIKTIQLHII